MKARIIVTFVVMTFLLSISFSFSGCGQSTPAEPQKTTGEKKEETKSENSGTKIKFVTGDWAPYTSDKREDKGIASDILAAILKDAKIEYELEFYPWERCEKLVQDGEAFATFPYAKNEKREAVYNFSEPFVTNAETLYYYKTNKKIDPKITFTKFDDLKKYSFLGIKGYVYEEDYKKAGLTAEWATDEVSAIKMLKEGRGDIFDDDPLVLAETLKKTYPGEEANFIAIKPSVRINKLAAMCSKKYPNADELLKKFNDAIKAAIAKGLDKEIYKKNGVSFD